MEKSKSVTLDEKSYSSNRSLKSAKESKPKESMTKITFNMGDINTRNLNHIGFTSGRMLSDPDTRPSEFFKSKEQSALKGAGSKILSDFSGALSSNALDKPPQTVKFTPRNREIKVSVELVSSKSDN